MRIPVGHGGEITAAREERGPICRPKPHPQLPFSFGGRVESLSSSHFLATTTSLKGYIRMPKEDEREWMDTMNNVHASVKGGMKV